MNLLMFRIAPLALSLLFFSFPLRAEAQDAKPAPILLVEVVSDDRPLPGASVVVNGRAVISDAKGRVAFDVPPGEYDIGVEATGYLPATRRVVLSAQSPSPVLIALSNSGTMKPDPSSKVFPILTFLVQGRSHQTATGLW